MREPFHQPTEPRDLCEIQTFTAKNYKKLPVNILE